MKTKKKKQTTKKIDITKNKQKEIGDDFKVRRVFTPNMYDEIIEKEKRKDMEVLTKEFLDVETNEDFDLDASLEDALVGIKEPKVGASKQNIFKRILKTLTRGKGK